MSAAWFALGGALIGVLGTVLTDFSRGRRDDRNVWREELRSVCSEFVSEVAHLQDLNHELRRVRDDSQFQRAAQETHSKVRALHDKLRLTSKSVSTQEAARWLLHCSYYQWRSTQGGPGDFWQAHEDIRIWLAKFYVEARKELDLGRSHVYQDPPEGFPIPGSKQSTKERNPIDQTTLAGGTWSALLTLADGDGMCMHPPLADGLGKVRVEA